MLWDVLWVKVQTDDEKQSREPLDLHAFWAGDSTIELLIAFECLPVHTIAPGSTLLKYHSCVSVPDTWNN